MFDEMVPIEIMLKELIFVQWTSIMLWSCDYLLIKNTDKKEFSIDIIDFLLFNAYF